MPKIASAVLTALFISASSLAQAQAPHGAMQGPPSAADLKALLEMRIDLVKTALRLTPDQQKLWPAVEEAIRARAAARQERLAKLTALATDQRDRPLLDLLRERADSLALRASTLRKYVDAWQPLYQTLDEGQKVRLRFVAVYMVHELRDALASRLSEYADEDDE